MFLGLYHYLVKTVPLPPIFPPKDDLPRTITDALDWSKTVIGGSYALKQLTGARWEPRNVDIIVSCRTADEFDQIVAQFEEKSNLTSEKGKKRTYKIAGFDKNINLIALKCDKPTPPQELLATRGDAVCVSYSVNAKGEKMFYVPEKAAKLLFTGNDTSNNIGSEERKKKYESRGFKFY